MTFYKYKIFNVTKQVYFVTEYYSVERLTKRLEYLTRLLPTSQLEVHAIKVGSVALVVDPND